LRRWHKCPLQIIFQLFASGKLLGSLVDNLPNGLSNLGIEGQQFFILLNAFSNPRLSDATSYFSMLFGSLTELLPLRGVISSLQVGAGLLGKYVLN
jgi:hypothetical protein